MEFLDNYKNIITEEKKILQSFLIENFKKLKKEGRSIHYVIDSCESLIYKNFIETNFISRYSYHFERIYTIFQSAFDKYDRNIKNIDIIKQILKNEVKEEFQQFDKSNKISNHEYENDFDTITYDTFVVHLLKYHVAKNASSNLNRNIELYTIFYDTNDYSNFTLRHFDDHVINSDFYRKLFTKFYPNKLIPIAKKQKNEWGTDIFEIDYNPPQTEEEKITELKEKLKKPYFELDEKLLLLHYCLVDKYGIPLTERAKLTISLGKIDDTDLFNKNSDASDSYKKISLGIDKKGSIANKILLVQNIIEKLDDKDYTSTKKTLNYHKNKLINEEKSSKKK